MAILPENSQNDRVACTVALVDDEPGMRLLLTQLFEKAGISCLAYTRAESLLADPEGLASGVVVADIRLKGMSGLELLAELRRRSTDVEVVIISGHATVSDAIQAFRNQASAFFEKPFNNVELLEEVKSLREKWMVRRARREAIDSLVAPLSLRERQVMEALMSGKKTFQVAKALNISPSTVEKHRLKIFEKTGVDSVIQLIHLTTI